MQLPHAFDPWAVGKRLDIEAETNLDVFLREVVGVDEDFADLVGVFGILAHVGVVAVFQEAGVAALDGGDGVA